MPLTVGTRLGLYEIQAALGAGGMGEVYRARDTKLGRDVAIKVVAESFTHDPERVARFQREAQLLASLNHPHIATIYGLEEAHPSTRSAGSGSPVSSVEPSTSSGQAALHFLAMELVEGATLAERIERVSLDVGSAPRGFLLRRRSGSPGRWPTRSRRRTRRGSSIAT